MKARIFQIVASIMLLIVGLESESCTKMPINGDLDGSWRIVKMEVDGVEQPFYNNFIYIQFHVVQLARNYGGDVGVQATVTGNFHHNDDMMVFDFPFAEPGSSQFEVLKYWGIYTQHVEFRILELTSKRLVIESETTRLECQKF